MPLLPGFRPHGSLIAADALDAVGPIPFLTVGYKITDKPEDAWTARFNDFKNRNPAAVQAGAATLVRALGSLDFSGSGRIIVLGAISSADTQLATDCPVHALCAAIARANTWQWPQSLLTKRTHRSIHGLRGGAAERDAEVHNAYTAGRIPGTPGTVAIIDDFVTRGATTGDIKRAVELTNPGWRYWCISLGKTERSQFWGDAVSNDHIPARLAQLWDETVLI